MRVVIVDDMLGQADDDDEWDGRCERCGQLVPDGTGAQATVWFVEFGEAAWTWCDECADSFTAWRLSPDQPRGDGGAFPDASNLPGSAQ